MSKLKTVEIYKKGRLVDTYIDVKKVEIGNEGIEITQRLNTRVNFGLEEYNSVKVIE